MQSTIDTPIVHHKTVADLLKHRNTTKLKTVLRSCSYETVMLFIGELYKGNGWIISYHLNAGKPDAILLSYPKSPLNIMLIVRVEDSTGELSFKGGRANLLHFENELASQYHCTQFCLICLSGFEEQAQKLENFNLLLQDWSYVEDLVKHYHAGNKREPRIQLFAHNKLTYKKVQRAFSNTNTVAVVQATGTGKSFLIARLLHDYAGENRLVLAPSHYILEQLREHIRWDSHIKFMTYTRAMYLTEQEIRSMKLKFIVLDEFHRCGAEEWGRGVQNIFNVHPEALVFGTTATPVRYLDNNRDMAAELFNGTIAENINLAQAIVRSILPMPKYITALYTLKEEADKIRNRITNSVKSFDEKKQITLELDTFEIEWENSFGVPEMLRKNITGGMNKFIVFCKEEEHLNEMEALGKGWFSKAFPGKTIKTFRVLNAEKDSDKNFKEFKTFSVTDEIHLLFSINMLNEGLHVNEVNGVILLRPTASPTIFYQQIGRCLKVGGNNTPLIFDLVNNFNNIRSNDFLYDLEMERNHFLKERNDSGLSDRCPVFTVIDETRKITEIFGKISFQLDTWNEMYERLTHFYKNNGHTRVIPANCTDNQLVSWVNSQRQRYKEGYQSAERIAKLNWLQFEWAVFESQWEKGFEMLVSFKNETGHCRVPSKEKKWSSLSSWMTYQRKAYKEFNLPAEKVKRLESVGFSWYPVAEQYDKMFAELKSWFREHGHTRVDQSQNQKLASFVSTRKYDLKTGQLSKEKLEQLNALDPKWSVDYTEDNWNNSLLKLMEYKEKFGHCDVSQNDKVYGRLGEWITGQRVKRRKGMLSDRQIEALESAGVARFPIAGKAMLRKSRVRN